MLIEVRLYATLRRYRPSNPNGVFAADVADGISVAKLINKLEIDPAEIHMIMVNGIGSEMDCILADGDRVGLFPAVGGG
jgi:molybdopterin converting factor small subunit